MALFAALQATFSDVHPYCDHLVSAAITVSRKNRVEVAVPKSCAATRRFAAAVSRLSLPISVSEITRSGTAVTM
ncbi:MULTISPECIES: hypothetical protein [Prauserella salsuginis group]|uniref:Uncharacterized protein n=1 Tax=Prauserella salsuginis TaxID=387889 RepID=A0ABW6G2A4_9PSEU|nr:MULTISPECIES: hypothetical protein [Prauserella salsuginis group]